MSHPQKVGVRPSRLASLHREKNVLRSHTRLLKGLAFSSWTQDGLCDVLWAALLHKQLGRERCLSAFRVLITIVRRGKEQYDDFLFTHSSMSLLDDRSFDLLMGDFLGASEIRQTLTPLLLLESLPDRAHWARHLNQPNQQEDWHRLAEAVAEIFDHQSQAATDIRWLKPMALLAREKMFFASHLADKAREIVEYPDFGDMKAVRPSIRANEIGIRARADEEGKAGASWSSAFWKEAWENTSCLPFNIDQEAEPADHTGLFDAVAKTYNAVMDHFYVTIESTDVNAKHDASFGLVFFVLQLLFFSLRGATGQALPSRFVLRSAVEAYITLSFLQSKDDPTIWMQYRNFGAGQARLALLKLEESSDSPSFVSKDLLESLANEDTWHEFLDIKLGAWSDKNLRRMAEEAGVKDVYDRHYDALSGYVHGNWGAVRHSVYGVCLNPLHRFHRVPMPPRLLVHNSIPDLRKIANMCLDRLEALYPPFKPRLGTSRR